MEEPVEVRLAEPSDVELLLHGVAEEVFDGVTVRALSHEFLRDARHHLAVALREARVVGFASAVHYVHPDKAAELWINEVGVAPPYQRQGIGHALLSCLRTHAATLGCRSMWVLADAENASAQRFYEAFGGTASAAVMYSFDTSAQALHRPRRPPPG